MNRQRERCHIVKSALGGLSLLLACACQPSAEAGHAPGRQHILLITVEGLRADGLGAYAPWFMTGVDQALAVQEPGVQEANASAASPASHTPNLDRLAERALVYGYALATSSWCAPSLASLFASAYPSELQFTDLSEPLSGDTVTLAEVLSRAGWRTQAFVEHPFLANRTNLDQGFAEYEQFAGETAGQRDRAAFERTQKALKKLGRKSTFTWVQLGGLGPPYHESGEGSSKADAPLTRSEWLRYRDHWEPEDLQALRAYYDREVARIDWEIGELLATLEAEGWADQTVVVVTASNGCELLERGMVGDGVSLFSDQVRVPLMIAIPGERAGAIGDPVSLIDVAPSLLRLVGLSAPSSWRGIAALPYEPVPARPIFSELSRARSLRAALVGDHKLIWDAEKKRAWLYDVFEDPFEHTDLASQRTDLRDGLLEVMSEFAPQPHASDRQE